MKRIKQLIQMDYANYKKTLLALYVTIFLFMIFSSFATAYDFRSELYTYNESTASYYLTGTVATRPEESLDAMANTLFLRVFLIISGVLPLLFTGKVYIAYQLFIPDGCIPENCFSSFLHSLEVMRYYPFTDSFRFVRLMLTGICLPAAGILVFELSRGWELLIHWFIMHLFPKKGGR